MNSGEDISKNRGVLEKLHICIGENHGDPGFLVLVPDRLMVNIGTIGVPPGTVF